jgi:ketosteroid isomerase-like protein
MAGVVCGTVLLVGCGQKADNGIRVGASSATKAEKPTVASGTDPARLDQLEPPAKAVYEFLEAVRTGNDAKATAMLTKVAREKALEADRTVRPAASDTARFQIGTVEYVAHDGARVATTWTDIDEDGEPQTDEALWVLRKEEDGWRVAGVAATVFDGEPPLLLNFEDPEEMLQKQQWVRDEVRRRAEQAAAQSRNQETQDISIRR